MKIGPNSNADSRFYIETGMKTKGRDMGYFHIEDLRYQSFNKNGDETEEFDMIENGCNRVGPLVEFKGKFYLVF